MNLYQKHRSTDFFQVKGHKNVVSEFQKRFKENNIPQVMYFYGNSGTGKTTIARIIGKHGLCENIKDGKVCGVCLYCKSIDNELSSENYTEKNGSNLNIEAMRNLEEFIEAGSFSAKTKKFIVLDEIQELVKSQAAMKNLLKILEKKIKDVHIILLSMDNSKIPDALKNRAVSFYLKDLSTQDILEELQRITEIELKKDINSDSEINETLTTLAENSNGSLRTAIAYLERCIYGNIWNKEDIMKELQLISQDTLNKAVNRLLKKDISFVKSIEVNDKFIEQLTYKLLDLYKHNSGLSLENWKVKYLNGISLQQDIDFLKNALSVLFDLQKYNYTSKPMLEYFLLNIVNYDKFQKAGVYLEEPPFSADLKGLIKDEKPNKINELKNIEGFKQEIKKEDDKEKLKKELEEKAKKEREERMKLADRRRGLR